MSEQHLAAHRLLAAALEMQALLTEETDGTHLWQMIRTVVSNARAIEIGIAIKDMFGPEYANSPLTTPSDFLR